MHSGRRTPIYPSHPAVAPSALAKWARGSCHFSPARSPTIRCRGLAVVVEGARAMNIVEICKQYLSGDLLSRLGNLIGEDPDKTRTAAGAAIPALLAGITNVAGSGADGARRLSDAVDSTSDHLLGNMSSMLGGGQGGSRIDRGREMLGSVLGGGNVLGSLGGALGRFSGMGSGSMLGLLGGLLPLILGVLKKAKGTMNLDARGLANMLGG